MLKLRVNVSIGMRIRHTAYGNLERGLVMLCSAVGAYLCEYQCVSVCMHTCVCARVSYMCVCTCMSAIMCVYVCIYMRTYLWIMWVYERAI